FGDAPAFTYPYLWSWGGKEVEADGKTVVLNSPATVESVKFMVAFWKDAHDEGGLAWDDSNNNRAFLSGTCSATLNGASIYIEALRKPDTYKTEAGGQLKDDILHAALPKGPGGQFSYHVPFSNLLMGYSKNQDAAKKFLGWIHSMDVYDKWFVSQKGFSVGPTTDWEKHKLWGDDPIMLPYKQAARTGRFAGYQGPSTRKAAEIVTKYIIIDMYAKAVQGMPAEDAVKWAEAEVKPSPSPVFVESKGIFRPSRIEHGDKRGFRHHAPRGAPSAATAVARGRALAGVRVAGADHRAARHVHCLSLHSRDIAVGHQLARRYARRLRRPC